MGDPSQLLLTPDAIGAFAPADRDAVYSVLGLRRDVRHFRPELPVPDDLLERILGAAHLAPSVGFSQPWGFVIVRDREQRARIRESFLRCREAEAARFPEPRRTQYLAHRLEGILEAPLNLCVAVDLRSRGEAILGTTVQPEAVRASAACAVQNLWLAARAEGVGVGWVSIVEPQVLRAQLQLPAGVEPIAYLCVGYPVAFRQRPMLEETGWDRRRPLVEVVHREGVWSDRAETHEERLFEEPALVSAGGAEHQELELAAPSQEAEQAARAHQDQLTKPKGSLGRLEELGAFYAAARGQFPVAPPRKITLALFAADHGVVEEGVSAYGSSVTAAMLVNAMAGGAAICALASATQSELVLVDAGVAGDLSAAPRQPVHPLLRAGIRAGTRNFLREPAMERAEAEQALKLGARVADQAIDGGAELLAGGEIGIGNTTSAAALICALTGLDPSEVVGRGTGIGPETLTRKLEVVREGLARHALDRADPVGILAAVGGLELGALAGFYLRAAQRRVPVVLDGFLSAAAALLARAIDPRVVGYLLASHVSAEKGGQAALAALGLKPLFDLGLRLGEGTGALLGAQLLRDAVVVQSSMATFATAGIADRAGQIPKRFSDPHGGPR